MSRRNKTNTATAAKGGTTNGSGPPPSHPLETLGEHRVFLSRSLDRNDQELAALVELNRSLALVRRNIVDTIGESTLLDLGEGKLQVTPCGTDLMIAPKLRRYRDGRSDYWNRAEEEELQKLLPPKVEQRVLCVDFLLRLKLRRRLLNRLARRLLRLGHAMDGEDVAPPVPPKYGEARFALDRNAVEQAADEWQRQKEARDRIDAQRRLAVEQLLLVEQDREEAKPNGTLSSQSKLIVETLLPLIPVEKPGESNTIPEEKEDKKEEPADISTDKGDAMEVDADEGVTQRLISKVEVNDDDESGENSAEQTKPETPTRKDESEGEETVTGVDDSEQKKEGDKETEDTANAVMADVESEKMEGAGPGEESQLSHKMDVIITEPSEPEAAKDVPPNRKEEHPPQDDVDMKDAENEEKEAVVETVADKEIDQDAANKTEETENNSAATEEILVDRASDEHQPPQDDKETEGEIVKDDIGTKVEEPATETKESAAGATAAKDTDAVADNLVHKKDDADGEKADAESESGSDMFAVDEEEDKENDESTAVTETEGGATTEADEPTEESAQSEAKETNECAERNTESPNESAAPPAIIEKAAGDEGRSDGDSRPGESEVVSTPALAGEGKPTCQGETPSTENQTSAAPDADAATVGATAEAPPTSFSTETPMTPTAATKEGVSMEPTAPPSTIIALTKEENAEDAQPSPLRCETEKVDAQDSSNEKSDQNEIDAQNSEGAGRQTDNVDAKATSPQAKEGDVQPPSVKSKEPEKTAVKDNNEEDTEKPSIEKDVGDGKEGADESVGVTKKVTFAPGGVGEAAKRAVKAENEQHAVLNSETSQGKSENRGDDTSEQAPEIDKPPETATSSPIKHEAKEEPKPHSRANRPSTVVTLPDPRELSTMERDFEVVKEFVGTYEKEMDPMTGQITFKVMADDEEETEQATIKYGVGVNAMNRSVSIRDKDAEYKRWKTALLERIPEAPTFEEIGANQVYKLEERRKRLREEQEKEKAAKRLKRKQEKLEKKMLKRKLKKMKKNDSSSSSDDSDDLHDDSSDDDDVPATKKNVGAVERKSPTKKSQDGDEKDEPLDKPVKPMSLVPIPSFHDQDLRRLRLIHADMMITSRQQHAHLKLQELNAEYDQALGLSNKILERKTKAETQLNQLVQSYHSRTAKMKQEYSMEVTIARNQWLKQKTDHDAKRLEKLLPTHWGRHPIGTNITQSLVTQNQPGSLAHTIGLCVGDLVDAVIIKTTTTVSDEPYPPFKPSPFQDVSKAVVDSTTGETFGQYQHRMQQALQKEITALTVKLQASEEERKRAWKKMAKERANLGLGPMATPGVGIPSGSRMVAASGRPSSASHGMPSGMTMAAQVASYTPAAEAAYAAAATPSSAVLAAQALSDSKYSAARIKERVLNDGSVAPVSQPKQTKDGLFMRPAGRKRKGMEWDAHRGIWVPDDQNSGSN